MRKLLLLFLTIFCLSSVKTDAQIISDFTFDSCYFGQTIGLIHRNINDSIIIANCANEFGYLQGDNEIVTMGTRLVNMGPHNKGFFGQGYYDSCHFHIHLANMVELSIQNACWQTVREGVKLGFNIQDGGNFMSWLLSGQNQCDRLWLENTYGMPDYALSQNPPDPSFDGDDHMGLSAGYYDTYGPSTYGNGIVTNDLPNGTYYACVKGNFNNYMQQGLNIFPDSLKVPFTLSGTFPVSPTQPRTVVVGGQIVIPQPTPVSVVTANNTSNTSNVMVNWTDANNPCRYKITPVIIKGNGQNQTAQVLTNISMYTNNGTQKSFVYPYSVLHDANLLLGINGVAKYRFEVRAVNGNSESSAVRSSGQPVNIK